MYNCTTQRGARTTNRFDSNFIFQKILIKMESMTFKIHSSFLTESKIIFCMIAQGSHVLPNRFPGGQHYLFLAVSWSSQKIWALAGRSDSVEERACSCENDFVRLNLLVILAGQGHITRVPAGVKRFQGACGGAAVDLNVLHFTMTLVLVMFSIGIIMRGQHSS